MKTIEDLFRESDEIHDPPEGHVERFMKRLDNERKEQKIYQLQRIVLGAAATIAALSLCWWFFSLTGYRIPGGKNEMAVWSPEFTETENYYRHLIDERTKQIESLPIRDSELKSGLVSGLDEMSKSDDLLRKELQADPGNELIVNALIEHYQTRITILNRILEQLTPIRKQLNFNAYENRSSTF